MCKETVIQSACSPVVGTANHQAGSGRPENWCYGIVLAVVLLNAIKYAASAEHIPPAVHVTACTACILKLIRVIESPQLGLTGSNLGMHIHIAYQRQEPILGHLHIRVEQNIVFGLDLTKSHIVTLGKAPVLFQADKRNLRELTLHHLHGVILGVIIGHNHLHAVHL